MTYPGDPYYPSPDDPWTPPLAFGPPVAPRTPADGAPEPPARPSQRRFLVKLLAIVLGLLAIAAGGAWGIGELRPTTPKVALPAAFDGYTRLDNGIADRVRRKVRASARSGSLERSVLNKASIAAYSRNTGDQPVLIVVALPRSVVEDIGAPGDDATAAAMLNPSVPDNTTFQPGPQGGALRCGSALVDGERLTACAWSDSKTAGTLLIGDPQTSSEATAAVTNDLRDLID